MRAVRPTLVAAVAATLAAACSVGPVPAARAADRYTPVVQSVMSKPRWFSGADGRVHLAYELELTNGFRCP